MTVVVVVGRFVNLVLEAKAQYDNKNKNNNDNGAAQNLPSIE